jgi:Zn-dependent M28 family amino/carboxypeptidase
MLEGRARDGEMREGNAEVRFASCGFEERGAPGSNEVGDGVAAFRSKVEKRAWDGIPV